LTSCLNDGGLAFFPLSDRDVTPVFDHFHIIRLFNEKLTELRRDLCQEAGDVLQKEVLKGNRGVEIVS